MERPKICVSRFLYNDIDKNNDELKKKSMIILGLPHFAVILCQKTCPPRFHRPCTLALLSTYVYISHLSSFLVVSTYIHMAKKYFLLEIQLKIVHLVEG